MENKELKRKIDQINKVLEKVAMGDFSKSLIIPKKEDEFTELIVGINLMIDDLENLVKKTESKSEEYLDLIGNLVVALDRNGNIALINKSGCEILGYKEGELEGQNWFNNCLPEEVSQELKKGFNKLMKMTPKDVTKIFKEGGENEVLTKKGERKIIVWNNTALTDDQGNIIGTLSSGRDVSKEKEIQEKYKKLVENINDVIYSIDTKGVITYASPTIEKVTGWKPEEMIGSKFVEFIHKDQVRGISERFKGVLKGVVKPSEWQFLTKKGDYKWIRASSRPDIKDGKVTGITGVLIDVSEQKNIEEQLKENEERYKALFTSSPDAIVILEPPDWNFSSGNPAAIKIFGVKNEKELVKLKPQDVSPEMQPGGQSSAKKAEIMIKKSLKEGFSFFEWIHKRANGKEFPATVLLSKIKIKGEDMLQATVRDISEESKIEAQLREKVEELEKMNRLMIGRELKMVKLKEEIEKLKNQEL